MTTAQYLAPEIKAELLADGLVSVLTGDRFEERYFDRLPDIWDGNPEIAVVIGGITAAIRKDSFRFSAGSAVGNLSGITPHVEFINPRTGEYEAAALGLSADGRANFQIIPLEPGTSGVVL